MIKAVHSDNYANPNNLPGQDADISEVKITVTYSYHCTLNANATIMVFKVLIFWDVTLFSCKSIVPTFRKSSTPLPSRVERVTFQKVIILNIDAIETSDLSYVTLINVTKTAGCPSLCPGYRY